MRTLDDLRSWAASAPEGTTVPASVLVDLLGDLADVEPEPEPVRDEAPMPWRALLWTVPSETRIGRPELLEAVGRPASWMYRHTAAGTIPHRKLDGELVFVVGEIRAWLREREEIVRAGRIDDGNRLRLMEGS